MTSSPQIWTFEVSIDHTTPLMQLISDAQLDCDDEASALCMRADLEMLEREQTPARIRMHVFSHADEGFRNVGKLIREKSLALADLRQLVCFYHEHVARGIHLHPVCGRDGSFYAQGTLLLNPDLSPDEVLYDHAGMIPYISFRPKSTRERLVRGLRWTRDHSYNKYCNQYFLGYEAI